MSNQELKRFIQVQLALIEPQWTAEGKGGYWWGVKIGLETVLAKLETPELINPSDLME